MRAIALLLIAAVLCASAATTTVGGSGRTTRSGSGRTTRSGLTELKDRSDAIAVWDMQTMHTSKVANIVTGASEYDLTLTAITTDSTGLVFPPYVATEYLAAGTGTASSSAFSIYCAFKRTGAASGGSFGFTTLINSTPALIRTLDPEEAPRIHTPQFTSGYVVGRWNDSAPHVLCAVVEATQTTMYLDGGMVMLDPTDTTMPITVSSFDFGELTKTFAGTVYYAGIFNAAHNATTRETIRGQIQTALAARSVTVAPSDGYVVIEGDSISETNYVVGGLSQYHYSLTTLSPIPPALNFAFHGDEVANATSRASVTDTLWSTSHAHNVLSVFLGGNDVQNGASAATAFSRLTTYCAARKAAAALLGVDLKIIVGTSPVRDVVGFEAKRVAFNALINGGDASYDAVADFGSDTFLGDQSQADIGGATTYFADGIHPNAAGHARMTPIWKAAISPLLGQ